jgi:hypothetical protein
MDMLITGIDPKTIHAGYVMCQCPICSKQANLGAARPFSNGIPQPDGLVTLMVSEQLALKALLEQHGCGCGAGATPHVELDQAILKRDREAGR